jgi:hypothetical protein
MKQLTSRVGSSLILSSYEYNQPIIPDASTVVFKPLLILMSCLESLDLLLVPYSNCSLLCSSLCLLLLSVNHNTSTQTTVRLRSCTIIHIGSATHHCFAAPSATSLFFLSYDYQ